MTQILEHEKFEYMKTLADIGVQIAKGRSEVSELNKTKAEFFVAREIETTKRVEAVLKASESALDQAKSNQNLLTKFHQELENFALELHSWAETLSKQQQDFDEKSAEIEAKLSKKEAEMVKIDQEMKVFQTTIELGRQRNSRREVELNSRERMVNDKYQTLLRTEKRL